MGYHFRIDEASRALIDALTDEPSRVFGRLYSAYLLFLVTQHDKKQLAWIVENAPGLDSLTGRHLAYAVFAKSFPVKIRTDAAASHIRESYGGRDPARLLREIRPELLQRPNEITRLVEDGAFGVVLDGQELTALTYGSDLVARELGVLDRLPCLVVIDGVPAHEPLVVPLSDKLMPELFQRLRGAVAQFYKVDGHTAVRSDAETVVDIQNRLVAERNRDACLRAKIQNEEKKLVKLRARAAAPPTTPDPNFFRDLVVNREAELVRLKQELHAFSDTHHKQIMSLNNELDAAISSHRSRLSKTFSHCLLAELRSAGFQDATNAAKEGARSFLAGLFKPETLLKLWSLAN